MADNAMKAAERSESDLSRAALCSLIAVYTFSGAVELQVASLAAVKSKSLPPNSARSRHMPPVMPAAHRIHF